MLLCLEFLEANDVGLLPREPCHEILQTLVDVVDIESGDLQCPGLTRKDHSGLTRGVTLQVLRWVNVFEDEEVIASNVAS